MKQQNKKQEDDLDPRYWVRLADGSVVSRMHYERIASPWVSVDLTPEEQKEVDRQFKANVREYYKQQGYPIPDKYKD